VYHILVENNSTKRHLNYSVSINNNQPFYLPLDYLYFSRLNVNNSESFIIKIDEPGKLVLQVYECMGNVQILMSRDPSILHGNSGEGMIYLEYFRDIAFA